jgi:hypothetical protein
LFLENSISDELENWRELLLFCVCVCVCVDEDTSFYLASTQQDDCKKNQATLLQAPILSPQETQKLQNPVILPIVAKLDG